MGRLIVAGAGVCGMAAALMLADDGHNVTVLERDAAPPPGNPDEAFSHWSRRGVAQFTLAHWLHAQGTTIMREQLPEVYRKLNEGGGYHINIVKYLLGITGTATIPDDDQFDQLTGRRATIEWAMATAADEHPNVAVRRGAAIAGLTAEQRSGRPPHVTGVRLEDGETITGDLVIDATGRRSPTPTWLADIGAAAPVEHAEDSGFAYYGRYYRGEMPAVLGSLLAPYGTFSILTLPADNDTWAVTLYALSEDKPLRAFRDQDVFDRVMAACPGHAHWIDGEPISEMASMAGVVDRHREFVVDGEPCATGILSVADAVSCTNPSLGRGITLGLMHTKVLRESIAEHFDDPYQLALAYHERSDAEITPWHTDTVEADRRRVNDMRIYRDGGTPVPTDTERIRDTFQAAVLIDPEITRGFGAAFGCIELGEQVLARPGMRQRVLDAAPKISIGSPTGPDRTELLELVS